MLRRKFEPILRDFLKNSPDKILLVNGARQIGKSYIIRYVCKELFPNYIEIDLRADKESDTLFANVKSTDDFYFQLGLLAGGRMGTREDTMIFLDEIQFIPTSLRCSSSSIRKNVSAISRADLSWDSSWRNAVCPYGQH